MRSMHVTGYDRRKYVWKLLYIYMLGYEINFGHKQAADLIPKPKWVWELGWISSMELCHAWNNCACCFPCRYKDKQVGYMACSILLHEVRATRIRDMQNRVRCMSWCKYFFISHESESAITNVRILLLRATSSFDLPSTVSTTISQAAMRPLSALR